jgi:hypothetical protein
MVSKPQGCILIMCVLLCTTAGVKYKTPQGQSFVDRGATQTTKKPRFEGNESVYSAAVREGGNG